LIGAKILDGYVDPKRQAWMIAGSKREVSCSLWIDHELIDLPTY
jgi:hypothetical protein